MKAIKLAGLTSRVASLLRRSRVNELNAATRFRNLSAVSVAIGMWYIAKSASITHLTILSKGNVPQLIAPILTFAIYIGVSSRAHSTLDTTKLFTSLALILLASEPLFMLIGGLIELRSAIGCFARLEKFLQTPARRDTRTVVSTRSDTGSNLSQTNAVVIHNASFGWKEEDQFTIKNVSLRVPPSSVVMITGPVACGKSTLLKGLLGETPLSEGRVAVPSSDIAWCEQSPWLMVSCRILQ
jgi:ATP-binding cassette subfamily C (CFTR/MRP) protein 1